MLYAEFRNMSPFHKSTYLSEVFNRSLEKDKRYNLGFIRYNLAKEIQIRLIVAGFNKYQHIDMDVWKIDILPDEIWICGPKGDCAIPIEMIENVWVNHKEVFSRG